MPTTKNTFIKYLNPVFIETGSFAGDGIQAALDAGFEKIYSIELSNKLFNKCKERFTNNLKVNLIEGDVENILPNLIKDIKTNITFWLDAHESGGDTACGMNPDPIFQELDIIEKHPIKTHTIMIDDMRGYDRNKMEQRLMKINSDYNLYYEEGYVKNDVLVAICKNNMTDKQHNKAKQLELEYVMNDKNLDHLFKCVENEERNKYTYGDMHEIIMGRWFSKDWEMWHSFCKQIERNDCLEIGPGPFGYSCRLSFANKWHVIDPLMNDYIKIFDNKKYNPWLDRFSYYNLCAEEFIPELENKIGGVILTRNCLDHTKNAYKVIDNFSKYAKKDCYLLLWTDLYHNYTPDEGHSQITKDQKEFQKYLEQYWKIEYFFDDVRPNKITVEFGCRAKRK